jgi:hypothetical protein
VADGPLVGSMALLYLFYERINMTELDELVQKFPEHIIIEKCLWNGNIRIVIDHVDNDINNPLDYVEAFRKLDKIVSEI